MAHVTIERNLTGKVQEILGKAIMEKQNIIVIGECKGANEAVMEELAVLISNTGWDSAIIYRTDGLPGATANVTRYRYTVDTPTGNHPIYEVVHQEVDYILCEEVVGPEITTLVRHSDKDTFGFITAFGASSTEECISKLAVMPVLIGEDIPQEQFVNQLFGTVDLVVAVGEIHPNKFGITRIDEVSYSGYRSLLT